MHASISSTNLSYSVKGALIAKRLLRFSTQLCNYNCAWHIGTNVCFAPLFIEWDPRSQALFIQSNKGSTTNIFCERGRV